MLTVRKGEPWVPVSGNLMPVDDQLSLLLYTFDLLHVCNFLPSKCCDSDSVKLIQKATEPVLVVFVLGSRFAVLPSTSDRIQFRRPQPKQSVGQYTFRLGPRPATGKLFQASKYTHCGRPENSFSGQLVTSLRRAELAINSSSCAITALLSLPHIHIYTYSQNDPKPAGRICSRLQHGELILLHHRDRAQNWHDGRSNLRLKSVKTTPQVSWSTRVTHSHKTIAMWTSPKYPPIILGVSGLCLGAQIKRLYSMDFEDIHFYDRNKGCAGMWHINR